MTLTIQDLGALGEFFGSIAVLATLVYLALQTRQNTVAIAAQLDGARISSTLHLGLTLATSTELQEALREDWTTDAPSSNQLRCGQYWTSMLLNYQWQFVQAQRGLLPTFNKSGMAPVIKSTGNAVAITPVEKGKTDSISASASCATAAQLEVAACIPSTPVPALAFPEFINRYRGDEFCKC